MQKKRRRNISGEKIGNKKYRRSVNLRTNSFHQIFFDKPRATSVIHNWSPSGPKILFSENLDIRSQRVLSNFITSSLLRISPSIFALWLGIGSPHAPSSDCLLPRLSPRWTPVIGTNGNVSRSCLFLRPIFNFSFLLVSFPASITPRNKRPPQLTVCGGQMLRRWSKSSDELEPWRSDESWKNITTSSISERTPFWISSWEI